MSYCTVQDLIDRYGLEELIELTDRAGLHALDADTLARALADADGEIDAHLGGRYALPLDPAPPLLCRIACELAYYQLWTSQAPELVAERALQARKLLSGLGSGAVSLGLPPATAPTRDAALVDSAGTVWGRDRSGGLA